MRTSLEVAVRTWTGRKPVASTHTHWSSNFVLYDAADQLEGLVHELCHYVIATKIERLKRNLNLENPRIVIQRERAVGALEIMLFDAADATLLRTRGGPIIRQAFTEDLTAAQRHRYTKRALQRLECFEEDHPGSTQVILRAIHAAYALPLGTVR